MLKNGGLPPLLVWVPLLIVNNYSEFQVNIFSNNRDIRKCQSFRTTPPPPTTPPPTTPGLRQYLDVFFENSRANNQTLVSDADPEIPIRGLRKMPEMRFADQEVPTLRSTDNAGNSVNLVFGIIRLHTDWDFSVCIENR